MVYHQIGRLRRVSVTVQTTGRPVSALDLLRIVMICREELVVVFV